VWALAVYAGLTVVLTWPLVLDLGEVVPKDLGDPLFSTWALWWNASVVPFSEAWWEAPIFFPTGNAMALADHRVGLGVLTTPLIWAGASPLAAYGVAFLASFVVSAIATYGLCRAVGATPAASFIGGLVFGFHPFRAAHLEHVELLSAYWLPVTMLCLHRWMRSSRPSMLWLASFSLVLLALTSGYYYFYSGVLLIAWTAWFGTSRIARSPLPAMAAGAASVVAVAPVLWRYREAHQALGLSRSITEIEQLSADLSSFVATPEMLALWNLSSPTHPELALFPGISAVALVLLAMHGADPSKTPDDRWRRWRWLCAGLALVAAAAGVAATVFGPFGADFGSLRLSVSSLYKPFSIAAVPAIAALLMLPRVRAAWRRRSPLAFYVFATLAMWVLALGPTARFFGERVLYKAPYAWLMVLPGFDDGLRAPVRFAMLAALTLAVAAALAADRLAIRLGGRALLLWPVAALGIVADGWTERLPLPSPPSGRPALAALPTDAVVLELPLGAFEDLAAMYRGIEHGHRLANGYSGYEPAHYSVLRGALNAGRVEAAAALAIGRPLAIVVDAASHTPLANALVSAVPGAAVSRVGSDTVISVPARPAPDGSTAGLRRLLAVSGVSASTRPDDAAKTIDGDLVTAWQTAAPQAGGEHLVVDLGQPQTVTGMRLELGRAAFAYPRGLAIDYSVDGTSWIPAWRGDPTLAALRGALTSPATVPLQIDFAASPVRYLRVTAVSAAPQPWAVAELAVLGPS
jgi:hypothetical protein